MVIKIEKLDENNNPKSPPEILILEPVQRIEQRATFEPVMADTGEQREDEVNDPRFIHDYLKARRKFSIHERVHAAGGFTAEELAHTRMVFFTVRAFRDRYRFTWHNYSWIVAVTSARIVKVPAEDVYDFYLELVGIR